MKDSFFHDESLPEHDLLDSLAGIINSHGRDLNLMVSSTEPLVDVHQVVHVISPRELIDVINIISNNKFELKKDEFSSFLALELWYAEVSIETATPQHPWDEQAATEDLNFSLRLKNIVFNDTGRLNQFNIDYPTLQIFCDTNGSLVIRSFQTLRGGRTLENVLWSVIYLFHDAERIYKEISVFSAK